MHSNRFMTLSQRARQAAVGSATLVALVVLGACGNDTKLGGAGASSTSSTPPTTSVATSSTAPGAATTVPATAPNTAAPNTTSPNTTAPKSATSIPSAPACAGPTIIPADARLDQQISGDVDGVSGTDTVTVYSASDGTPHVFLQRAAGGGASDVALPLGNADTVRISFEDVDHSLGATTPVPLRILAIGAGQAGSAFATFLGADDSASHCLHQWTLSGSPFVFTIDQRGPYSGLACDGAAGKIHYSLRNADPDGSGHIVVTEREITHVGDAVTLVDVSTATIADSPAAQHEYGDIQNCSTPPIMP